MDLILIGFTVAAWLVHSLIAAGYSKLYDSTKSVGFRITHAAEIFTTLLITMTIYKTLTEPTISIISAIATVLGTLVILDGTSFAFANKLRQRFNVLHFIYAYTAITIAVVLAMQL